MILEVVILDIKPNQEAEFEWVFGQAQKIISSMDGYISHQHSKCVENPSGYILLVNWETLKDHTEGFRESEQYKEWRSLLHAFYDRFQQ